MIQNEGTDMGTIDPVGVMRADEYQAQEMGPGEVVPFLDLRSQWHEGHENLIRQARSLIPYFGVMGLVDLDQFNPGEFPLSGATLERVSEVLEDLAGRMEQKAQLFALMAVKLGADADRLKERQS